jgi:hypothetical protein
MGTPAAVAEAAVDGLRPPRLPKGIPMGTPEEVVAAAMDQVIRVERKMLILPLRRRMSRSKAKRKKWT